MEDDGVDRLAWLDLEMTGLDVERDAIVEVAVLVTDTELAALDDGLQLVVHQPPDVLARMGDHVRRMHTRSGLLPDVAASTTSLATAGSEVLSYLRRHIPAAGTVPLCGNSIGTDRRFLARFLPEVEAFLHYRSIDVSSLKELCRRWYPAAYKGRPTKVEEHRALADIRESIEELRYYRASILRPAGEDAGATPA